MKTKEGIISSKVDDEYFLVATNPGDKSLPNLVRLNETGAFIWDRLAEGLNEEQIVSRLIEEYDGVDHDGALRAVQNTVKKFRDANLLE